jgi:putative tryptophan/tyrosine transport system substrate-binding protein
MPFDQLKRRQFITLLGSAAAWPLPARAQQGDQMRRVGVLIGITDDAQGQARLAAFRAGMHEFGWTEGHNVKFDIRFTEGKADRAHTFAAELLALVPDVILANTAPVLSALQRTQTAAACGNGRVAQDPDRGHPTDHNDSDCLCASY